MVVVLWASRRGVLGDIDRLDVEGEGKEVFSFGCWVDGVVICWDEGGDGGGRGSFILRKYWVLFCIFWIEDVYKKFKLRC